MYGSYNNFFFYKLQILSKFVSYNLCTNLIKFVNLKKKLYLNLGQIFNANFLKICK